jgi:hypothetical protein
MTSSDKKTEKWQPVVGQCTDVLDFGKWYVAKVLEIDIENAMAKVKWMELVGYADEWMSTSRVCKLGTHLDRDTLKTGEQISDSYARYFVNLKPERGPDDKSTSAIWPAIWSGMWHGKVVPPTGSMIELFDDNSNKWKLQYDHVHKLWIMDSDDCSPFVTRIMVIPKKLEGKFITERCSHGKFVFAMNEACAPYMFSTVAPDSPSKSTKPMAYGETHFTRACWDAWQKQNCDSLDYSISFGCCASDEKLKSVMKFHSFALAAASPVVKKQLANSMKADSKTTKEWHVDDPRMNQNAMKIFAFYLYGSTADPPSASFTEFLAADCLWQTLDIKYGEDRQMLNSILTRIDASNIHEAICHSKIANYKPFRDAIVKWCSSNGEVVVSLFSDLLPLLPPRNASPVKSATVVSLD